MFIIGFVTILPHLSIYLYCKYIFFLWVKGLVDSFMSLRSCDKRSVLVKATDERIFPLSHCVRCAQVTTVWLDPPNQHKNKSPLAWALFTPITPTQQQHFNTFRLSQTDRLVLVSCSSFQWKVRDIPFTNIAHLRLFCFLFDNITDYTTLTFPFPK